MKNKGRTFFALFALVAFFADLVQAVTFDDYKNNYTTTYLKPLAKDLGALMGGGTFRSGRVMGFPGIDVGGDVFALTSGDSPLLKGQLFFMPYARAEVGLPILNVDVQARAITYSGLTIIGGGAKYALPLFPSLPAVPSPSIAAVVTYHLLTFGSWTDQLNASTFSVNAVLSYGFPGVPIEPYIGAGMDFTSLTAKYSILPAISVSDTGTRLVGGLNLSIFPLVYATGEVGLTNSSTSFALKVGIKLP